MCKSSDLRCRVLILHSMRTLPWEKHTRQSTVENSRTRSDNSSRFISSSNVVSGSSHCLGNALTDGIETFELGVYKHTSSTHLSLTSLVSELCTMKRTERAYSLDGILTIRSGVGTAHARSISKVDTVRTNGTSNAYTTSRLDSTRHCMRLAVYSSNKECDLSVLSMNSR